MVESEAKELSEEVMLGAVTFGRESFQPVIHAIVELAEPCAREPWSLAGPPANKTRSRPAARSDRPRIEAAYGERGKQERSENSTPQGRSRRAVRRGSTSARWR